VEFHREALLTLQRELVAGRALLFRTGLCCVETLKPQ
jgi:hypothetical protein